MSTEGQCGFVAFRACYKKPSFTNPKILGRSKKGVKLISVGIDKCLACQSLLFPHKTWLISKMLPRKNHITSHCHHQ